MATELKHFIEYASQAADNVLSFPMTQLYPKGYREQVWCRGTDFRRNASGAILCTLNNAEGAMCARISRPDVKLESFKNWQVMLVDLVTVSLNGKLTAEVMRLRTEGGKPGSYLDLMPRAVCALPRKLDELRELIQYIQAKELRQVLETAFSDAKIVLPFLTCFGGRESYTYPSGLLAKTVAAAKVAIGMGFESQEEADMVLTTAILYDLGRIQDVNLTAETIRKATGIVPHAATLDLVRLALNPAKNRLHASLEEILATGYCDQYPSLHRKMKQQTALAKINVALLD
ncbi:hypothetical protein EDC30_11082 [Paucimonas lemoignei]|uniref:HD domain-containing protein n=2 Tax=Paucimonas lemoignei TaxID=29443 RepID=A0A4R3HT14_PAULE|nr:hypothetical protein EDC30_11082 [Paucimonas lemoignei]